MRREGRGGEERREGRSRREGKGRGGSGSRDSAWRRWRRPGGAAGAEAALVSVGGRRGPGDADAVTQGRRREGRRGGGGEIRLRPPAEGMRGAWAPRSHGSDSSATRRH